MTAEHTSNGAAARSPKPRVEFHGEITIGDIALECAVLDNGERGFIQRQMVQAIGFAGGDRKARFGAFCDRIGLKAMLALKKTECPVLEVTMPSGGTAQWISYEVFPNLVRCGSRASRSGKLTKQQAHIGQRCEDLADALIDVAIAALIDEATGYQHRREPDALQKLFSRLVRSSPLEWERRFQPEFYKPLMALFGWKYEKHRALPNVIGLITERWVYEVCFPPEILAEVKARRGSQKLHQWLTESDGLALLKRQCDAVALVAKSSVDYADFEARASVTFHRPGQQVSLILSAA